MKGFFFLFLGQNPLSLEEAFLTLRLLPVLKGAMLVLTISFQFSALTRIRKPYIMLSRLKRRRKNLSPCIWRPTTAQMTCIIKAILYKDMTWYQKHFLYQLSPSGRR